MQKLSNNLKVEYDDNRNEDVNYERDKKLKNVQTQLIDLSEKFDNFLNC